MRALDELRGGCEHNIVLITLDCCRFDTACRARTPTLDKLGTLREAWSAGTFTLPAHMAMFSGYLPNVTDLPLEDYYSRERFQLWRLSRAKKKAPDSFGLLLEGDTILEGFAKRGYGRVGAGGVRWFLTQTLRSGFDKFMFWGPNDYEKWFQLRADGDFALDHVDELVDSVRQWDKWFLFVNSLETHAPYNNGVDPFPDRMAELIERASPIFAGRREHALNVHVTAEEFKYMHLQQIRALEVADQRIGRLFDALPKPFVAIVAGDHGESFGENGNWGHGFPAPEVLSVPLIVGSVDA
jgi:hypothetical protein